MAELCIVLLLATWAVSVVWIHVNVLIHMLPNTVPVSVVLLNYIIEDRGQ